MCAIDRLSDFKPLLTQGRERSGYFYDSSFDDQSRRSEMLGPMPESTGKARRRPPSGLPAYMAELWSRPLLNESQEQHCFRKLNLLKYLASQSLAVSGHGECVDATDTIGCLLVAVEDQRNEIVVANLRLVVSVAKRRSVGSPQDFEEMVAVGNAALLRAADLFDFRRGFRFSTYAYQAIERAIFGLYRRESRYQQSKVAQADQVLDAHEGDAGDADRRVLAASEAAEWVGGMLQQLDQRDQHIIRARFGINRDDNGVAFHVIASEIGLSTTRTVQLFHRSMQRMRALIGNTDECESTQAA